MSEEEVAEEKDFSRLAVVWDQVRECDDGDMVIEGAQPSRQCYIVLEGTIDIFAGERFLESVTRGGIFGEMALIDKKPASATAIVRGGAKLAVVDVDEFLRLVRRHPTFALDVMEVMSGRIRRMDAESA